MISSNEKQKQNKDKIYKEQKDTNRCHYMKTWYVKNLINSSKKNYKIYDFDLMESLQVLV